MIYKKITDLVAYFRQNGHKNILWYVFAFLTSMWLSISYMVFIFEHKKEGANILTLADGIWWGIVTFLTVGYGDKYPITTEGRVLGACLMIAGVTAVGILTAKISSHFLEQALKEGRGFVNTQQLKNHFIICGWTEDMSSLLNQILDFNNSLHSREIVVIAQMSDTQINLIKSDAKLKDTWLINGEYYLETFLKKAAPERAKKILVLADRTPLANGQTPSPIEVDARTIMTCMTLANIARGTLVAAEILDPKMDHYLKLAHVSEIIYSREYSRLLLGNVSGGTGIANVIFDLLDPSTAARISTEFVVDELRNKPYSETRSYFQKYHPGSVLLGVLENSGNQQIIREKALRHAQQTPNVAKLVENLKAVRTLRCNHPIFNPSDDYIVTDTSMVILLTNRNQQTETKYSDSVSEKAS